MSRILKRTSVKDNKQNAQEARYPTNVSTNYINPITLAERKNQFINFLHAPTGKLVSLPAVVTTLQDNYTSNFRREPAYGRMDPIMGFQNTTRTMQISIKVPAGTYDEAKHNYNLISNELSNMLYPTYKRIGDYRVISQPPIIGIKHVQLISSPGKSTGGEGYLFGALSGLSIVHNFDIGAYEGRSRTDGGDSDGTDVYPKFISLSFSFQVLHNYDRGFNEASNETGDDLAAPELGNGGVGGDGDGPSSDGPTLGINPPAPKGESEGGPDGEPSDLSDADREDPPSAGEADSPSIGIQLPIGEDILGEGAAVISIGDDGEISGDYLPDIEEITVGN